MRQYRPLRILIALTAGLFVIGGCSQAAASEFTASSVPVDISGSQVEGVHVWSLAGSTASCKSVKYISGMTSSGQTGLVLNPDHDDCTAFGFPNAKFTGFEGGNNGCVFFVWAWPSVDLACTVQGQKLVLDAGTCTVTIPPQSGIDGVAINNDTSGHLRVILQLTGIEYEVHKGFLCPAAGSSTEVRTDGEYEGVITLQPDSGSLSYDV